MTDSVPRRAKSKRPGQESIQVWVDAEDKAVLASVGASFTKIINSAIKAAAEEIRAAQPKPPTA